MKATLFALRFALFEAQDPTSRDEPLYVVRKQWSSMWLLMVCTKRALLYFLSLEEPALRVLTNLRVVTHAFYELQVYYLFIWLSY